MAVRGLVSVLTWASGLLVILSGLDLFAHLLQVVWGVIFRARRLRADEIAASLEIHPAGFIPYARIRVDEGSLLTRINGGRAVSTMHLLHYPRGGLPLAVAVHELSHVVQYERAGAIIMAQALHAQYLGEGYDYGDLGRARRRGKCFRDFNREQQAQICEDYYRAMHDLPTRFRGTLETLEPFVADMQRGEI